MFPGTDGDVTFGYDWAGRTTSVAGPGGTVTSTWRLDGLLDARTIPTTPAEVQAVAYDALRRPTLITRSGSAASTGSIGRTYTRSGATATDERSLPGVGLLTDGTVTYAYDATGHLLSERVDGVTERTYAYDPDGNRTARTDGGVTTTYEYAATDQLVRETSAGVSTDFGYDVFGNMIEKAGNGGVTTTLAYADGAHLTSITVGTGPASVLAYDALGRTATRTSAGVTETSGQPPMSRVPVNNLTGKNSHGAPARRSGLQGPS